MTRQKLISALQSRIAKQKTYITLTWIDYQLTSHEGDKKLFKEYAIKLGVEQKHDKQILKQLVEDERSIKEWKARFDTAGKALGIIAEMREGL